MPELRTRDAEAPLGRAAELAALTTVLDGVAANRSAAVVVHGDAGQGKTALLEWVAGAARNRAFAVVQATGIEFERGLAFSGLTAVLRPLLHRIDDLTDLQAQALRGALGLAPDDAPVLTVYAATLSLLSLGADASPVLVVVDDAHWVDPSSLEALIFAAHRCDAEGVGFAFAQRTRHPSPLDQARFPRLPLHGLGREAAVELLRGEGVTADVAAACWGLTNGNPLALIEGARGLTPAQRRGQAPLPAVLPVDDRLLDDYRHGLAGLPPTSRRALGVAALASDDDLGIITSALTDLGGRVDDLEPAEQAGFIVLAGGRARWRHPLLRCAAHDEMTAVQRRTVHRALAGATADAGQHDRASWHLAESVTGPDDEVAGRLAATASTAYRRGALAAAAEAYEQAARLASSPEDRHRHLLDAADVRWAAGDFEQAGYLLGPAIDGTDDPLRRAQMALILGQTETWVVGPHRSVARLESHARAVDERDPALSAVLRLHAAVSRLMTLDLDGARTTAGDAATAAERSGDMTALAGAYAMRALTSFFAGGGPGSEAAIEPIGQLALAALDDKDDQGATAIVSLCAYAEVTRGRAAAAVEMLTEVIDRSDASGMLARSVLARMVRADAQWRLGRWAESLAEMTHLLSLQEATSRRQLRLCATAVVSRIEAGLGLDEDCRRHARETIELASSLGIDQLTAWAFSALGLLDLAWGRHADAAGSFDRVAALIGHVAEPGLLWWHADAIEAYHACGRGADARELLDRLDAMATATRRGWAQAAADRCAALLDDGDPDERLTRARDGFREVGAPFDEARTLLARGEHRLRDGRRPEGALDVATARTIFDRLGARRWSDRASALRSEASATASSLSSRLTKSELRVALAVAGGASNRAAADNLFISAKTVDYHLQSIYRKLGLRSRTQLAALVAADRTAADLPLQTDDPGRLRA